MPGYPPFHQVINYLRYYFSASNGKGHGMHSPFVFDFITSVLNDRQQYPAYDKVEGLRRQLLHDPRKVSVQDFGAGSVTGASVERSVASIAKHAAKPAKYGQLLYRIVQRYRPATILELGTSLGITTSYLASGDPAARLITMEGAAAIAGIAKDNLAALGLQPQLVEGNFDDTLAPLLATLDTVDFAFIDGNHRQEPTLHYFQQLLKKVNNDSVLVFDDIHWSADMEQAWHRIRQHTAVRCSIDLFFIGIVLFRQEFKEVQHFAIRF